MVVPFPKHVECDDMAFEWVGGFEYPSALKQELRDRFPEWKELHESVTNNDTIVPWVLLDEYERRLGSISMADIIKSAEDTTLHKEVVERAKQTVAIHKFTQDIKKRYFPQGIQHEINKLMKSRRD